MGREERAKKAHQRVDRTYGYHAVAYIDLPGQRRELAKLRALPHDAEHEQAALDILLPAVRRVRSVRKAFMNFVRHAGEQRKIGRDIPEPFRGRLAAIGRPKFFVKGFSDSFVISMPLHGDHVRAAIGLFSTLYGIAGMSLVALSIGRPLRGGLDVERGINLYDDEVYGPGLVCAYELERDIAQYPRTVVGDGVLRFLNNYTQVQSDDPWIQYAKQLANESARLISRAPDDGRYMVHMLSPSILEMDEMSESASKAYNWVVSERARFASEGEHGLESYYARLAAYFESSGITA